MTSWWRFRRPGPADPRARELVAAAWLLYQETGPDDMIAGVSIDVISADGELVAYSLAAGRPEILRFVTDLSDPAAVADAYAAARVVVTDATVEAPP